MHLYHDYILSFVVDFCFSSHIFPFFLSQCQILLTDIESVWFATRTAIFPDMWPGRSDLCCFPFVTVIPVGTAVVPYTTAVCAIAAATNSLGAVFVVVSTAITAATVVAIYVVALVALVATSRFYIPRIILIVVIYVKSHSIQQIIFHQFWEFKLRNLTEQVDGAQLQQVFPYGSSAHVLQIPSGLFNSCT